MFAPKPSIEQRLIARAFTLPKLLAGADRDSFVDAIPRRVKAIVAVGGHDPLNAARLGRFAKLEIVVSSGVGYDHIDVKLAAEHGIVMTNPPDVLLEEVGDTALGL